MKYAEYLKSSHWRELRQAKLAGAGRACNRCGSTDRIVVHHVRYRNLFDVELADLEVLCQECHDRHHRDNPRPKQYQEHAKADANDERDKLRQRMSAATASYNEIHGITKKRKRRRRR